MKRRLLSLLLSLCLVFALLPGALAQEEEASSLTALCVARPGQSVPLDVEELRILCRQATGHELERVSFPSPYSRAGTLTCKGERVTPDITYYLSSFSPQLSQISFTPTPRFTGQAEVSFLLVSEKEETLPGTLFLYVFEEPTSSAENYSMEHTAFAKAGQAVDLMDLLPKEVWYNSRSASGGHSVSSAGNGWYRIGADLTSAVFTLPSSDQGSLWLDYGWSTARKVLPEEVLYPDREPNFYNVTFIPASSEGATVCLHYAAACEKRGKIPGVLTLTLTEQASSQPTPSKPATAKIATVSTDAAQVGLADILYQACASRQSGKLQTITFDTLPPAGEGTILSADLPVTVGTAYPYGSLAFLPGESFQGGLTLRYVGTDSTGQTFSGALALTLDYPPEGRFRDLTGWEWAAYAVQFLDLQRAVPYARSDPRFRPGEAATRMELIYSLVQVAYSGEEDLPLPSFPDLPADEDLARAAAVAAAHGLVLGDEENRLLPDAQVTRQDALTLLYRALTELGQALPAPSDLSAFSDAGELAPYARQAAGVLCARGILRGDGSGKLNPLSPITRAEMACLLYRAFGGQG